MITLKDSYTGNDLLCFFDEKEVVSFINKLLGYNVKKKDVKTFVDSGHDFLGYVWASGYTTTNCPIPIVLSVRNSKRMIDNFFIGLDKECKKTRYIVFYDNKIIEEFYNRKEIEEYFKLKRDVVHDSIKRGYILKNKKKYKIKQVNLKPAFDFKKLDYSQLLKYAKQYDEDNSFIDLVMDLDIGIELEFK